LQEVVVTDTSAAADAAPLAREGTFRHHGWLDRTQSPYQISVELTPDGLGTVPKVQEVVYTVTVYTSDLRGAGTGTSRSQRTPPRPRVWCDGLGNERIGKQRRRIRPLRTTVEAKCQKGWCQSVRLVERPWLPADCVPCVVEGVNRVTSNWWYQRRRGAVILDGVSAGACAGHLRFTVMASAGRIGLV
jgi:hypothetical protein